MADAGDLTKLSASEETQMVELLKFGETLVDTQGNAEPSLSDEEGVESGRGAPKEIIYGEGALQTTNIDRW